MALQPTIKYRSIKKEIFWFKFYFSNFYFFSASISYFQWSTKILASVFLIYSKKDVKSAGLLATQAGKRADLTSTK